MMAGLRRAMAAGSAIALALASVPVSAQGVAPGGGIGNSTGIGSGLGGVIGTGPSYPNGTTQPSLPPAPPPGGYGGVDAFVPGECQVHVRRLRRL